MFRTAFAGRPRQRVWLFDLLTEVVQCDPIGTPNRRIAVRVPYPTTNGGPSDTVVRWVPATLLYPFEP